LRSDSVRLQNGRGVLRIPYNAEMRNDLMITAYAEIFEDDNNNYYADTDVIKSSRAIIYPAKRELQVDVKTSEAVYRPGEEARIDFNVAKANGGREESALGVVVFDKAVEERARTDSEFGGGYSLYGNYYGLLYGRSFGSLSRGDLDKLDLRRKISPDLELAAELLLSENRYFYPNFFGGDFYTRRAENVFRPMLEKQFNPIREKLNVRYANTYEHPSDDASLKNIFNALEIDFNALRDPWGMSYQPRFKINRDADVLELVSAGADKKIGTNDDFTAFTGSWNYFRQIGDKINTAVAEHHKKTGGYVRDLETLQTEMRKQGVDINNLRDRWGKVYKIEFDVERAEYLIRLSSGGENGRFEQTGYGDDFIIWTNRINYFANSQAKIDGFLSSQTNQNKPYPKDEAEFKNLVQQAGVDFASLRDGWNRPFYLLRQNRSLFTDRIKIESVAKFGEKPQDKTTVTPVTQQIVTYQIRSVGADGIEDTSDDFIAAVYTGIIAEQAKTDEKPVSINTQTITSGGRGAVTGVATDPIGAVIPGATVSATNISTSQNFAVTTDSNGVFLFQNLPSGLYKIQAEAVAFQTTVLEDVPVRSANLTTVDFVLGVANVQNNVEVTVTGRRLESLPTANRTSFGSLKVDSSAVSSESQNSVTLIEQIETPRLREYFPETLVWQPELITDKNGRAELKFKLADSLTTWKVAVIGSTLDGEVGLVEKEFQAFMPFFAEHDPPKILTEGDKIALPVVLRNYLDKPQTVTATMANGDWFRLINNPTQKVEVAPNASSNAVFNFEAVAAVKEGKQRVTAIGADASDAIEKPVTVKPDGREVAKTQGTVFRESAAFDVNFPADTLPRTAKAELKIYPNLMSHVVESIEGILQRPYGCGEQTISSTYPSLLVLKADKNGADSNLKKQARKYLQAGFERLIGYKAAGGGFAYWSNGEADLALTAYALRFLTEAEDFIDVDESLVNETRDWLVKQQTADGSWKRRYDNSSDINLTAYISRTLSKIEREDKANIALQNALAYLQKESAKIDEPYILANLALALFNAQREKEALLIAEKLRGMVKREATGAYWNLEINTPFNGWGNTGRVETTALVLQALVKAEDFSGKTPQTQALITEGLQFLFKQKDRYGVWYSTQTTINVLDTLIMLTVGSQTTAQNGAEIFVNGQKVQQIAFPPVELTQPLTVDLTRFLASTDNRVEVRQIGGFNSASAQVVQNYYVAWNGDNTFRASDSNGLRLLVNYDKTTAQISEEITCRVEVERTGFRGYGMLLAEIGLPPGADVDRESITAAMRENYNVSRYDVLPDKVIFYLWAQAGGTKFNFKFKPRYGIEAKTAASTAYDYYNPEAQATLAPTKFLVR
jgi:tetratricopeptide (TPR) repeat protein